MRQGQRRALGIGAIVALVASVFLLTRGSGERAQRAPAAVAASSAPARMPGTHGATTPELETESTVPISLSGYVLDQTTGDGVANAHVTLGRDDDTAITADTDADGAFTITLKASGRYVVTDVSAKDYLPFSPEWSSSPISVVARAGGRIDDVTLYLRPMVEYTGIVEGNQRARVAGAAVKLVDLRPNEHASDWLRDEFVSDNNGEFKFYAPEGALLEARHRTGSGRGRVDANVAFTRRFVIRLDQAADAKLGVANISGRVVDMNGMPLPGYGVQAVHIETDRMHPRAQVRTAPDGRFEIDGLDIGAHVVWAVCEGCASTRTRVMTGGEVTLTVGLGGAVAGRVVDGKDGRPVQMFAAQLIRMRGTHQIVLDELTVVDHEGRFEFRGLPAGSYMTRAAAQGHATSDLVPASVSENYVAPQEVTVRLRRGASIDGVVVDSATKAPIARARVAVEGSSEFGSSTLPLGASTLTDGSGRFVLSGIAPGARSVRAGTSGYHMALVSGLQAADGGKIGPLEVKLTKAGANEQPQVELTGIGARLESDEGVLRVAEVVEGGGAKVAGLKVGDVVVAIDGEPVVRLGVRAAIERTRGPAGSTVLLSLRGPNESLRDVPVQRRSFRY